MTKRKSSAQCLLFMSTAEASLGDGPPKLHTSKRDAIEEAIEWIGRSPHYRAYIDCINHQQFTYEDLVRIRSERAANSSAAIPAEDK
jgi:hypothetical protein